MDSEEVSLEHSFIPGTQVTVLRVAIWASRLWRDFLWFTLAGYNVFKDSEELSKPKFQENVACGGGAGSSIVFSAQTYSKDTLNGCDNIPSDPFNLKITCGQSQEHQAVQLAFQDRSSVTLGFGVHCEHNYCGSVLVSGGLFL